MEGGTEKDMETQARDIEFLIKERQRCQCRSASMATIGFSFGGLSNVLAQMRNSRIKAIVSLDAASGINMPHCKNLLMLISKDKRTLYAFSPEGHSGKRLKEDKIDPLLTANSNFTTV
jgi:hypothetical protein